MKRHAVALRDFTHAEDAFTKGDKLFLEAGQFDDWSAEGVDLVRAATEADIAKDKAPVAAKPKATKPAGNPKVTPPAPATTVAVDAPAPTATNPATPATV